MRRSRIRPQADHRTQPIAQFQQLHGRFERSRKRTAVVAKQYHHPSRKFSGEDPVEARGLLLALRSGFGTSLELCLYHAQAQDRAHYIVPQQASSVVQFPHLPRIPFRRATRMLITVQSSQSRLIYVWFIKTSNLGFCKGSLTDPNRHRRGMRLSLGRSATGLINGSRQ